MIEETPVERKRRIERARYHANKEARKAQVAAYRAANPDKCKALREKWRHENPEKWDAFHKQYRDENQEKHRIYCREWRQKNRERADAKIAEWHAAHPEWKRIKVQNRRARKMASGGRLSRGLVPKLLEAQGWRCIGCACDLRKSGYHLDHQMPLARGGAHADENMQMLCPHCNCTKGARDPVEWEREMGLRP